MSERVAIITGITGQDGYYLTKLLLEKEYTVLGLVRRCSLSNNTDRIAPFLKHKRLILHNGDLSDSASLRSMIHLANSLQPSCLEIYNLAAQSHVQRSFEMPEYTMQIDAGGVLNLLEAIRSSPLKNKTRFYQASTSELYGKVVETPQKETTPFYPRSPYGVAKLYGFWITKNYRESYEMFAVNGILFNHESPMRGEDFVTRKITKGVVAIQRDQQSHISIGNLDAKRDWGHAKDYVEAMWLMLQTDVPRDWVVATGSLHSVREFLEIAFTYIGKTIQWEETGLNEIGRCAETGQILVKVDPAFFRPAEVELLLGDSTDIRKILGWSPTFTFSELVKDMMFAEMAN